jgi:mannose-6-phosphate isomerase-like protein (cupin superfamily)
VRAVNVTSCDPDEVLDRGEFRHAAFDLTERLGARVIGATVFEMQAGAKLGPYHYHHGVEEWMYVVSGAPILRDPNGERALEPGDLVAFRSGPLGAHTVHGPGRIVMFSRRRARLGRGVRHRLSGFGQDRRRARSEIPSR